MKVGTRFQGKCSFSLDRRSVQPYVASLVLANLKDKATVIFGIYVEIAKGVFIEVEKFHGEPLVIPAFGAYAKEYEPISLYISGMQQARIDKLFSRESIFWTKSRLVLSTGDGMHVVKTYAKVWEPADSAGKNLQQQRFNLNGEIIGGRAVFKVTYFLGEDQVESRVLYDSGADRDFLRELGFSSDETVSAVMLANRLDRQLKEEGSPLKVGVMDLRVAMQDATHPLLKKTPVIDFQYRQPPSQQ